MASVTIYYNSVKIYYSFKGSTAFESGWERKNVVIILNIYFALCKWLIFEYALFFRQLEMWEEMEYSQKGGERTL